VGNVRSMVGAVGWESFPHLCSKLSEAEDLLSDMYFCPYSYSGVWISWLTVITPMLENERMALLFHITRLIYNSQSSEDRIDEARWRLENEGFRGWKWWCDRANSRSYFRWQWWSDWFRWNEIQNIEDPPLNALLWVPIVYCLTHTLRSTRHYLHTCKVWKPF